MKRDSEGQRIALFIDFENLVTRTGMSAQHFDVQPALDVLLEKGKVLFRRAYCDWSRFPGATRNLHERGVELIDVPPSTRAGKNAADVRLVIDALELAYLREHIDTFVIASGDSDFCPLAYKLREIGRTVIGMGMREATSPLFVKACDEFVYLKGDGPRRGREGGETKASAKPAVVPELAREAVASILARATGPVNPSAVKEAMVRKEPDFDEREHGFSTFKRLLEAMEKEGLLKREQGAKGQWYVVAP
ncbi:MAG TPA: NYN domain-containing protein [Anaeromyxobacteraceae bacterium]|nr:NYN domain-containing protein [Anaeromyxobacteraceae bacterium]